MFSTQGSHEITFQCYSFFFLQNFCGMRISVRFVFKHWWYFLFKTVAHHFKAVAYSHCFSMFDSISNSISHKIFIGLCYFACFPALRGVFCPPCFGFEFFFLVCMKILENCANKLYHECTNVVCAYYLHAFMQLFFFMRYW